MQDGRKAVWSIPYVSVAVFPGLKQNFIAYRSSNVSSRPDCIFEIHQLWQSGFSRVYSNLCFELEIIKSFELEIIKIGQSSHKIYSNNIVNFQESPIILNACTKSLETYIYIYIYIKPSYLNGFSWFYRVTLPIMNRSLQVYQTWSSARIELMNICICWSVNIGVCQ